MAGVKLTAKGVASLSTDRAQEDVWDALVPGLLLRVSGATGRKTWYVRYRLGGKRRRHKLGTYPDLQLAKARERARDALTRAETGDDPAVEKANRRAGRLTFEALAREVLEARATKTREATRRERERLLEKELLPEWGAREAPTITRREVVQLTEAIARRGAPVVANRTLALIRLLFNDGLRRGFPGLESNPAHLVEAPGDEDRRLRYLKAPELRAVWKALETETPTTRGAFRLAMLTAQRIGSIASMRWDAVTGDIWTIPASDFKGKRTHLVPLSAEALAVLDALREVSDSDEWVFPSRAGTKKPYVTNLSGSLQRVRADTDIPHWTLHDLRTTFRTHATRAAGDGGLGIPAHVADAVLGHKEASLGFDRYTGEPERYLLHEKREALQKWGAFVRAALEATP